MKKIIFPLAAMIAVVGAHAGYSMWHASVLASKWVTTITTTPWAGYLHRQDYFMGLSYGLAAGFSTYALIRFLEGRRNSVGGLIGGLTWAGILSVSGCFLVGCCGSPMLAVYIGLFGSSFAGLAKPLSLGLTSASVVVGYIWMNHKSKNEENCGPDCGCHVPSSGFTQSESSTESLQRAERELATGMELLKCQQCGCMKDTLDLLTNSVPQSRITDTPVSALIKHAEAWLQEMKPVRYACLGCDYCYGAVASNALQSAIPELAELAPPGCAFDVRDQTWPPVPGEYHVFCDGDSCPVAVTTLFSTELSERLAELRPKELCIVGKLETENIGIDKIVKNVISNATIRTLIVAGKDTTGHCTGQTLLALSANGVDQQMRVIGSEGKRPVLRNVSRDEVEAFREQVTLVDMIGCEDVDTLVTAIQSHATSDTGCVCGDTCSPHSRTIQPASVPTIIAQPPKKVEMDRAGYFVILPLPAKTLIRVEHYNYDNTLLRVIEGSNARDLHSTIIANGWVTQLSHAAYLGRNLEAAELSMKHGFKYVQDGA
jgi:tetrahydromethanopterin S-methyltransferase subunit A